MTALTLREPYVGSGSDGAFRSAQIDREEADTVGDCSRRADLLASAARWEVQAEAVEHVEQVVCADCERGKDEARDCEACGEVSCCVRMFDCRAGYEPDGQNLCPDCSPSHRGCPECDPPDPYDR